MPSLSKPAAVDIPTSRFFLPASAPQAPPSAQPPPAPVSTVIITSLAPNPPTTATLPAAPTPTAVTTIITQVQVLTAVPTPTPSPGFTSTARGTDKDMTAVPTNIAGTSNAVYGPPRSTSLSRSSPHKPKSNVGKYVGYAIGAVFFLTLISSFYSAYRKHRKYALMRSVSNSSFDAYALSNSPPTSPSPVFLNGSQQTHTRGFSPSPLPIRPLPPTPMMKYAHEDDSVFFPHVPRAADAPEYSAFGVSSSGSSTQTTSMK
ncbi:hypothetical protein C8R46DRAFT_1054351 [Mycena filopes]|nr:hypothetical protein C8R46DRAFT_1054351 [Mycena filopes]